MPTRTVKGPTFTIVVDGKKIVVKHVYSKGKRCRVIAPEGVTIETGRPILQFNDSPSSPAKTTKSRQSLDSPQNH